MKRKIISQTYLKEALKYELKLYMNLDDMYISVKKLINVSENFSTKDGIILMADGYYVVEVIPKNENYAMRIFVDDQKRALEYYFDICKIPQIDPNTKIPFYDDLYLDITFLVSTGEINILDKDELDDALEIKDITDSDYELVMKVKDKLLFEIKNHSNKYLNLDYSKYLY